MKNIKNILELIACAILISLLSIATIKIVFPLQGINYNQYQFIWLIIITFFVLSSMYFFDRNIGAWQINFEQEKSDKPKNNCHNCQQCGMPLEINSLAQLGNTPKKYCPKGHSQF